MASMMELEPGLYEPVGEDSVLRWRAEELTRAGYGPEAVALIAGNYRIDLHLAVTLLQRGCPETTALRILL